MKKNAILLFSEAKREYFPTEQQYISEAEVEERAHVIGGYLEKLGFTPTYLPGNAELPKELTNTKADIVFNLVDSVRGQEYLSSVIPALLELSNIPYTGTGQLGLAISTNKFLTNKLLEQAGILVPRYQLFNEVSDSLLPTIQFPLITKLNSIHGSIEMGVSAIVENEKDLRERLRFLMNTYHDEVLVSEYIGGREVTAILLEGIHRKVYAAEKIFEGSWKESKYKIASFDAVWGTGDSYHYQKIEDINGLKDVVKTAYEVLKMDDYAKFDIRVDEAGRYYFIDANPNPALGPKEAECAIGTILDLYDINFDEILTRLIENTLKTNSESGVLK